MVLLVCLLLIVVISIYYLPVVIVLSYSVLYCFVFFDVLVLIGCLTFEIWFCCLCCLLKSGGFLMVGCKCVSDFVLLNCCCDCVFCYFLG